MHIYINTNPGNQDTLAPDAPVNDYTAWVSDHYDSSRIKDGDTHMHYGIAQKINALIYAGINGQTIRILGPYAGLLAQYLESKANGAFEVEIL